jgi:hypothetical protein
MIEIMGDLSMRRASKLGDGKWRKESINIYEDLLIKCLSYFGTAGPVFTTE